MTSYELGWIIADEGSTKLKDFLAITANLDGFCTIPGTADNVELWEPDALYLETHPIDDQKVFISWRPLEWGATLLNEPETLGKIVRKFLAGVNPTLNVMWGVIVTDR